MTTSSEDVLMQVSQVRYKKGDGTLYVMNERIAWMLDNKDTVSVSHKYADIKLQKISPEGKSKIQLQVVLHDGTSSTFHFVNRRGQEAQIKDRDDVKELLQQLLPKFKRKVNKELEEKNRTLQEHPSLLQLYRDLVITQVISSEEFWSQYAAEYTQAKKSQRQEIGVNSAFLADIKPQTDGCNGLKYNLTVDVIECIFKTYPAVKRKHQENVPHKMSESDFWTKFFQSHYFHRDRINAGTKDLFTECAKIDDQELKKDLQSGINDPLLDITSFEDQSLDENYGSGCSKSDKASGNIVHQSMIKRFNQHSIMVLKASTAKQSMQINQPQLNGSTPSASKVPNDQPDNGPKAKKLRIQEKIMYDDLDTSCDTNTSNGAPLKLTHVDRYLHGPVPGYGSTEPTSEELLFTLSHLKKEASGWVSGNTLPRQTATSLVSPAAAVSALGELTPGGSLMKGFREESLGQLIPKDLEKDLRNIYVCTCELLRHFWRSFPPTTPQLEEKATRMHEALHRFHSAKLKPFEDRVQREFSAISQHLTSHLNQLLNTAYRKFAVWQQRKMQMRSSQLGGGGGGGAAAGAARVSCVHCVLRTLVAIFTVLSVATTSHITRLFDEQRDTPHRCRRLVDRRARRVCQRSRVPKRDRYCRSRSREATAITPALGVRPAVSSSDTCVQQPCRSSCLANEKQQCHDLGTPRRRERERERTRETTLRRRALLDLVDKHIRPLSPASAASSRRCASSRILCRTEKWGSFIVIQLVPIVGHTFHDCAFTGGVFSVYDFAQELGHIDTQKL